MTGERKKEEIDCGMNSIIVQCSRICANHDLHYSSTTILILLVFCYTLPKFKLLYVIIYSRYSRYSLVCFCILKVFLKYFIFLFASN